MTSQRSESQSWLEPRRRVEAGPSLVTAQEGRIVISQSHSSVFKESFNTQIRHSDIIPRVYAGKNKPNKMSH